MRSMTHRAAWAGMLLSCALGILATAAAPQSPAQRQASVQQPAICIVVRTYWGHGGDTALQQRQGLRRLLTSLRQQSNPK